LIIFPTDFELGWPFPLVTERYRQQFLTAIIDWFSRFVLSWRLSNTLDSQFCAEALDCALSHGQRPEIFNTDQGKQFTSNVFTGILKAYGITISMDGRGRALDNVFIERLWRTVKYEEIYLNSYTNIWEIEERLRRYFDFYCRHRPHQALAYVPRASLRLMSRQTIKRVTIREQNKE